MDQQQISPEKVRAMAVRRAGDYTYALAAGHSEETLTLHLAAYERLVARLGYDPLA